MKKKKAIISLVFSFFFFFMFSMLIILLTWSEIVRPNLHEPKQNSILTMSVYTSSQQANRPWQNWWWEEVDEWVNKWVNARSYKSVFLHLSVTNECRIVWQAEIGPLSLSLSLLYSFCLFLAVKRMKNLQKRKSKSYFSSNGSGGCFLSVLKRETVWFDFLLLSFSHPLTYIHIHIILKSCSLLNKTRLNTLIQLDKIYTKKKLSYLLVKCNMHRPRLKYAFSYFLLFFASFSYSLFYFQEEEKK